MTGLFSSSVSSASGAGNAERPTPSFFLLLSLIPRSAFRISSRSFMTFQRPAPALVLWTGILLSMKTMPDISCAGLEDTGRNGSGPSAFLSQMNLSVPVFRISPDSLCRSAGFPGALFSGGLSGGGRTWQHRQDQQYR